MKSNCMRSLGGTLVRRKGDVVKGREREHRHDLGKGDTGLMSGWSGRLRMPYPGAIRSYGRTEIED